MSSGRSVATPAFTLPRDLRVCHGFLGVVDDLATPKLGNQADVRCACNSDEGGTEVARDLNRVGAHSAGGSIDGHRVAGLDGGLIAQEEQRGGFRRTASRRRLHETPAQAQGLLASPTKAD